MIIIVNQIICKSSTYTLTPSWITLNKFEFDIQLRTATVLWIHKTDNFKDNPIFFCANVSDIETNILTKYKNQLGYTPLNRIYTWHR